MHDLYDRPDFYDAVSPRNPAMERFYVSSCRDRGGRVLELASGSGRLTVPLAVAGLEVVGGDRSAGMLERAGRAAKDRGVTVELVELDMRDFELGRTFDSIVVAANSLLHLHEIEEFEAFFACVSRHLADGGRLVFDAFVPSAAMLSRRPGDRHKVCEGRHEDLGLLRVEETMRYDPVRQLSHIDWFWSNGAGKNIWHSAFTLRQVFPQEMPLLIASGGLRLVERFGDFDGRPFDSDSWRQVCVCARN